MGGVSSVTSRYHPPNWPEGNGHATQGKSAIDVYWTNQVGALVCVCVWLSLPGVCVCVCVCSRKSSLPTVPLLLGELHLHAGVIKVSTREGRSDVTAQKRSA